jgi:hypothetical protein
MLNSSPPVGSEIHFAAAILFAERIKVKKRKIQLTKTHRGYMATTDNGWITIEKKWYS